MDVLWGNHFQSPSIGFSENCLAEWSDFIAVSLELATR